LVACATPPRRSASLPRSVRAVSRAARVRSAARATSAAALVERALRQRGFRFGTDGTVGALHGYLVDNGHPVPPVEARAGDVIFFDLGTGGCQDHVGLAESVDPDGRITFREARDGQVRTSYLH